MRESSRQGYSGLWTSTAITRKYTPATLAHMEDNTEMRMKRTEWSTCMYLVRKTSRFALRVEFTARYASSRRIIYIIYIYEANRGTCNQEPHRHALGQQPGRHMHENIAYLCTWYVRVLAMYIYCYTYVCLQACDYRAIVTINESSWTQGVLDVDGWKKQFKHTTSSRTENVVELTANMLLQTVVGRSKKPESF